MTSMDFRSLERQLEADPNNKNLRQILLHHRRRLNQKRQCELCAQDFHWFLGPNLTMHKDVSFCEDCFKNVAEGQGLKKCSDCDRWLAGIFFIGNQCDDCDFGLWRDVAGFE